VGTPLPAVPEAAALGRPGAAFVTIRAGDTLRGCLGHVAADRPLGAVVRDMTVAAARDDPRFPPVTAEELPALTLEISVLTEPATLAPVDPACIAIGRDGLMVQRGHRSGVLLPQVATDQGWDGERFLAACCRKADLPPDAWREPGVGVFTFQADVFAEAGNETGEPAGPRGKGEGAVMPRIVSTPIAPLVLPERPGKPRRVHPDVIAAALPGPGRDRLAGGEVLAVTTGQQPGLFTGPLYTLYKGLSAVALARRLEREWTIPVVPVFWVAGDDHDFAEANHAWFLDRSGEPARIVLRERAPDAPLVPLWRERCGVEITAALERLRAATPDSEFKGGVLDWLATRYRPEASLADACAAALDALLGPRGLVVLCAHAREVKRASVPWILKGLAVTLPDGHTPVMVEGSQGRDRLRAVGDAFVTRRSGERFTRSELERIASEQPERLSPNVLLRPAVEAALLPTVAYAGGPAELGYLPEAEPVYRALNGVARQLPVPRWSGVLVEARVDKVLERHRIGLEELDGKPGELEARLVRDALPPSTARALAELRDALEQRYGRLADEAKRVDATLERTVVSARNAALAGVQELEKKLVASLKREHEALVRQVARARAAVYPRGEPQERMLTPASFLIRYGPGLVDAIAEEVARWTDAS
jgi:bacillithiol synthase